MFTLTHEQVKPANNTELLAIYLHNTQCRLEHVEHCGWEYDKDWSTGQYNTHQTWLKKAEKVMVLFMDKDAWKKIVEIENDREHLNRRKRELEQELSQLTSLMEL